MRLAQAVQQTGTPYFISNSQQVVLPFIMEQCLSFLQNDENNLTSEGILRKTGNNRRMAELQLHFDTRPKIAADFSPHSVHDVAGLLKRYIRELPEPLLTLRLQNLFLAAQDVASEDRRLVCMQLLMVILPKPNRDLLQAILFFLKKIASQSGVENGSKMDAKNLSIVFGPNLIRLPPPQSKELSLKQAQEEGKDAHELTEFLIDHCEELFSFTSLKICEYPLSRGDKIIMPAPLSASEKTPPAIKPSPSNLEEHAKLHRALSASSIISKRPSSTNLEAQAKRVSSINLLEASKGSSSASLAGQIPSDLSKASVKSKFVLTKVPSAPSLPFPPPSEGSLSQSFTPVVLRQRTQTQGSFDSKIRNSLPDAFDSPFQAEYVRSNLSNLSLEEENSEEEESEEEGSETEEPLTPLRSPSVAGSAGTIFQGKFMNRTLAQRIESDLKKKTKFVFGDIKLRYAMNLNKESKSVPASPAVDVAVNLDELNIHEVYLKLKDNGVEVKNRRKNLRVIKGCFVGKEAIDWLCVNAIQGKMLSRLQARMVAREMLEIGMMEAFEGEVDFRDDQAYYKFNDFYQPQAVPEPKSPSH